MGGGPHAGADRVVFGAPVRVRFEGAHVDEDVFDTFGGARLSGLTIFAEMSVGTEKMLFDEAQVSRDVRGADDPIALHALCACASSSISFPLHRRRDR